MLKNNKATLIPVLFAIASAVLACIYMPLNSLLLQRGSTPLMIGAFAHLGAGLFAMSAFLIGQGRKSTKANDGPLMDKKAYLYSFFQIVAASGSCILIMYALTLTTSANVALFTSFETFMTSIIALIFLKEIIHLKSWVGIILIVGGCALLSIDFSEGISFSWGSLLALSACLFYGIDNNLSRLLSRYNNKQVTMCKTLGVGLVTFIAALCVGERPNNFDYFYAGLIGIASIGISVILYMYAQQKIGAAKTSAFFTASPFLGTLLSILIFQDKLIWNFYVALGLVLIGQAFVMVDLLLSSKKEALEKPPLNDAS